jgi:hypothetical protein
MPIGALESFGKFKLARAVRDLARARLKESSRAGSGERVERRRNVRFHLASFW